MNFGEAIRNAIIDAIKEMFVDFVMNSLQNMVGIVSDEARMATGEVVKTPDIWNTSVFDVVRNISDTVIVPIAGIVLTYVVVFEFLQMISQGNNAQNFDMSMLFKWLIKSSIAIFLLSNTFSIVIAIFEVGAWAAGNAGSITIDAVNLVDWGSVRAGLMNASIGDLVGLTFETGFIALGMTVMSIFIFVITTGRMIQIYLTISLAPIPFATLVNRELGQVGQNYIKMVMALSFQAVLIVICLAIYGGMLAGCITNLAATAGTGIGAFHGEILRLVAISVVLCFTLSKTGSLSQSIFGAH